MDSAIKNRWNINIQILFLFILIGTIPLFAQNFWQQTNGPYGGDIHSIAINSSGHIFVGGEGVFRSIDNGNNWTPINAGLTASAVYSLAINSSGHIFAGTAGFGVFRSTDNGNNWTPINAGLTASNVYSLAINSSGHIFAGGEGVFRSTDNGNTWTSINTGLTATQVRSLAINSNGHIFVGTIGSGIFRSTDNGNNWIPINAGLTSTDIWSIAINSSGDIFAVGDTVYRSTDNGNNWTPTNSGLTARWLNSLAINSSGHIFTGGEGVFLSTDNGNNWTPIITGLTNIYVNELIINSSDHIFAGTIGGGVFRSTDSGNNWTPINTGLTNVYVYTFIINSSGHIFAGTDRGVFRSTNNGNNWTPIINADLSNLAIWSFAINSNGHIFAGTAGFGVFRSTDDGINWMPINTGLPYSPVSSLAINSSGHIFAGGEGVFRSTDNGNNWTPINTGLSATWISSLAINSSGHIFAGTESGDVFRSTDNGNNWTPITTGLTATIMVYTLAINSSGHIFAGTYDGGVFRSTDNGNNWTSINTGLTDMQVRSLAINSSGHIFAGTIGGGIFRSTDNGNNWIPFNDGLTLTEIYSLIIDSSGHIFASTHGGGVFFSNKSTSLAISVTTAATDISQNSVVLHSTVNPNDLSTTVKFEWGTTTSYGNEIVGNPNPISGNADRAITANLTGLIANTTYHYRIAATNSAGTSYGTDQSFRTYVSTFTLNNSTTFPSYQNVKDYKSTDYRIIGIPGGNNNLVSTLLSGMQGTDWQVYWDNGSTSTDINAYLVKYDGGAQFLCSVGRAFWLINKGNWQVNNLSVSSANLNTDGEAEILLHAGWNIITNPFLSAVDWNTVKTVNSISNPIIEFVGATGLWQDRNVMQPYIGYYFNNSTNIPKLLIPYAIAIGKPVAKPVFDWQATIIVSSDGIEDHFTRFGISAEASVDMDHLDYHKPRAIGNLPGAHFYRPEWDEPYSIFATDIRPPFDRTEKWAFTVNATNGQKVVLKIEGIENIPAEQGVFLIDIEHLCSVDLRLKDEYTFLAARPVNEFEIMVGDREEISKELKNLVPAEFTLGKNFPNPFNPETTIPVLVPERTWITLKIFDLLGKEVRVIFNGTLDAGKHYFVWEGNDRSGKRMPSGLYLYHLTTEKGWNFTGKMILVK